jgi:hypothetical protein
MYGVPVVEKFRVDRETFTLFHVLAAEAALEYFGIEGNDEGNVERSVHEMTIPKESIGDHRLSVRGFEIRLKELSGDTEKISISLTKEPLLLSLIHSWRR